jgi:hypothetical protein
MSAIERFSYSAMIFRFSYRSDGTVIALNPFLGINTHVRKINE